MKRIFTILIALVIVATGCDKEIPMNQELKTLTPESVDEGAKDWNLLLVTDMATQTPCPQPVDITTDGYKNELAAVKVLQANLTDNQRKIIEYWSAGGVLRWNEILRGLVAKYNLPPAPLPNGTYPAPDAENPFGDPNFPFANPPYAARAYSYVTAAQFEALKITWRYKYQYNRPAPYTTDTGIQSLMPKSTLPSYPSEEAVMSTVNAEVLKMMFPAAVEEITLKAAEQRNAALWSGKAVASDITAGLNLGKAVAAVFTARARTDGMSTAIGNKDLWAALKKHTEDVVKQKAWQSLETPPRPPMLPFFGLRSFNDVNYGVKAWMMTNQQIIDERPDMPPPTSSEEMAKEVEEVKYYSKNVTRERLAIVHKWADGAGTYTPPGHWDEIASHYVEAANMSEVRAARVFAYLNMVLHDAAVGCWETKYFYFNPRPSQMDPSIKTATGVPNFPAYTSGHSTFSGAAASVLSYLFPEGANYFDQEAQEASLSRMYGGIHYRSDCQEGLDHGKRIAQYTIDYAKGDGADID